MWQLKEKCEMTYVIIMIDTRIGITGVLDCVIDLVGQQTKGFRRGDRRWNRIDQDRRFQSNEFFVRRARFFEDLENMKETCTDWTQTRTGEIAIARKETFFSADLSFLLLLPSDDQIRSEMKSILMMVQWSFDDIEKKRVQPALFDDRDLLIESETLGVT